MDEIHSIKKQSLMAEEESHAMADQSLTVQKNHLLDWATSSENQEEYRFASRQRMENINKEFADGIRKWYGITEVVPLRKKELKQTVPAGRRWWLSRHNEDSKLAKARKKYGAQISINSVRERKAMREYEELRSTQLADYDIKSEEVQELSAFFGIQKSSWIFWKKTVGALGNETAEEKRDVKAYNKRLLKAYTKSKAGSKERAKLLDELREKIQSFRITPTMLTDGYLADNCVTLQRFADMTKAFRFLVKKNPAYLKGLNEEDRIMLENTINTVGPIIQDFLEKHQACKHLKKRSKRTVYAEDANEDLTERNNELMKETWGKILESDVKEQTAIGLKNSKVTKHLLADAKEAKKRRKEEYPPLPDYAIVLEYDTTGEREKRLLAMQDRMRNRESAYELIGTDMEKLFEQFSKSVITLDTIKARQRALYKAIDETKEAQKTDKGNRRYSAFIQYANNELKNLNHDESVLSVQADHYEETLKYVTDIRVSENDMTLPVMDEKKAAMIKSVLSEENLNFLLHLEECRFFAKEFTEISGGKFLFKEVMKDAIGRSRGQEVKLHTEKLKDLEKKFGSHKLEIYQILALKPEDLEKYNYDGYTDKEGVRHAGAHDLTDEVNFKHMKEIASIAEMDIEEAKKHLKLVCEQSGSSEKELQERMLDLETKFAIFKDYGKKWAGTYAGIKTESWKYLPQIPDMEGQNGAFKDPQVFVEYKQKLEEKLKKKESEDPNSPEIARYKDMISLMDAMMIRNGLLYEGDEDIKLLNAEAYQARYKQLKFEKRLNKAYNTFLTKPTDAKDRTRLINRAEDALFYEDKYAELEKTYGKCFVKNLMKEELDGFLKEAKTEEEKISITKSYYALQAVEVIELRKKLTPQFFTEEYIKNNFDEFAKTILTIWNFGRLINSADAFDLMMEGISDQNKDSIGEAVDVMISLSDHLRLLLFSVFSANSVDFETGRISYRHGIIKQQLELIPDEELAKQYQEISNTLKEQKKAKKEAEEKGIKQPDSIEDIKNQLALVDRSYKIIQKAKDYESDVAEDYLDYNLTMQLQKLRDLDKLLGADRKKVLVQAKTPTEELYRYLYQDKDSKNLNFAGDKEAWKKALKKASENKGGLFSAGLSKEARDVAKMMLSDQTRIEDYLQWKIRQDSRVYMNERSKMLGVKESQEDTEIAVEIMDSIEETHSSVHNSVNRKMQRTLFPELEKKGIDPEQFMHLLRIVHRGSSGTAGRMVDITNQSANMGRTALYLDPDTKTDFILQATTEVMKFEITDDMLSEEYLKQPGNFNYMYFMAQKLKAYEQLYMKDKESVEKALKEDTKHEDLLQRVNERFGTFYGNLSDQIYNMVMNFAAKYGVDKNGARTFGLEAEEYEQLSSEAKTSTFAKKSKENMSKVEKDFQSNVSEIRKRFAGHKAAVSAVSAIRKYPAFDVENWLKEKPKSSTDPYKASYDEQQTIDNKIVIKGMENAITLPEEETGARKKVKKLDSRLRVGDVAFFLPEKHYSREMKANRALAERDEEVLSLTDLFSGNAVRQMNYLLQDGHLEGFLEIFKKNQAISVSSKQDLSSEDYLSQNFTEEHFIEAKKMAVISLLPTIIPNLFDDSFIKEAGISEKEIKNSEEYTQLSSQIEGFEAQSESVSKNTREFYAKGDLSEDDKENADNLVRRMDRKVIFLKEDQDRLLPKLKTKEQRSKVAANLKELKKFIGSEKQREFYKNYAITLQKYARVCGVNVESPKNSFGSMISGMDEKKLNAALRAMRDDFEESQEALKKSMKA